ncbi:MAG: class I SAM-dependent methyltransferase [Acidobacteriia bacterium]|nr:class I SAM-dependent methyltransferase [Terriglobia bacterium]
MNLLHSWLCSSEGWRRQVRDQVIPWTLQDVQLGEHVLELGPGYGATTDVLCRKVGHLTCVEMDARLAESLKQRVGKNVTVLCEDATAMSLPDASFDAAVCFTMLHHVPSPQLQDRLLAEVARVLRPGGIFAGRDSRYSRRFRLLHLFDTMVLVDPRTFPDRLRRAGFTDVAVEATESAFRFRAVKPPADGFM